MIEILEKIFNKIRIYSKIAYWKIKYKKRIKIGKKLTFRKRFNILIDKDGYLEIGDNNFFNNDCSINCMNRITIGKDNLFGENVKIYDHNHVFNSSKEKLKELKLGEIIIGNYNWFGSNVTILKKTKLRDRNVVGANVSLNCELDSLKMITNQNLNIEDIVLREKDEKITIDNSNSTSI